MRRVVTFGQVGQCYEIRYSRKTATISTVNDDKLIGKYTIKRIILGYDNGPELDREDYKRAKRGSTVLLCLAGGRYIYVSDVNIYSFSTIKDDTVERFYSPFRGSLIPYPYLVCENYTYLLLARAYIANEKRQTRDPYEQYYNHSGRYDTSGFTPINEKLIHSVN